MQIKLAVLAFAALFCAAAPAQDTEELMGYAARGKVPPGYAPAYAATVKAASAARGR